ncbi:MAG TPA: hypothetical protein VMF60_09250 [Acidimicrobiales bacterium]|nr:hypothetical protein [Acidimicrobiales bacterium]
MDGTADDTPNPESDLERVRSAATLVMHDVEAMFGPDLLRFLVADHEEIVTQPAFRGHRPRPQTAGWVIRSDRSAIGIWAPKDEGPQELIVRVADIIQEGVIEGPEHWGAAFPPCPAHPNHPMGAAIIDGVASWVCPRGLVEPIPIGGIEGTR